MGNTLLAIATFGNDSNLQFLGFILFLHFQDLVLLWCSLFGIRLIVRNTFFWLICWNMIKRLVLTDLWKMSLFKLPSIKLGLGTMMLSVFGRTCIGKGDVSLFGRYSICVIKCDFIWIAKDSGLVRLNVYPFGRARLTQVTRQIKVLLHFVAAKEWLTYYMLQFSK